MKQFKIFLTVFALIAFASCKQRTISERLYVEKVEDSGDSTLSYKVTLSSDEIDGVVYLTNHRYEVGDTLASMGEFSAQIKASELKEFSKLDSLVNENMKLKKQVDELSYYNSVLVEILNGDKSKIIKD